jgi:hypothetical protein
MGGLDEGCKLLSFSILEVGAIDKHEPISWLLTQTIFFK